MSIRRVGIGRAIAAVITAGLLGSTILAVPRASGQEAGGAPDQLEEIVVTAQKRQERLLDVPMSVSALTADQLTSAGINSTLELQQASPGVITVNNGLGFVPVIRGVSSQGTAPGDESNVSIYLDDVYIGTPLAGFFDLADIEQVEILKGPQGTLFGRNATGGAIRIVTRKPSFTTKARVSVDYGVDYDQWALGAYVTGPFSETMAGSLSASYRKGDGHIKGIAANGARTYGAPDNYVVRGKLLFKPVENFTATLTADASQSQNDIVFAVTPPEGVNPFPGTGAIPSQPFRYAGSTQPKALVDGHGFSLDASWDPSDALTVRSITAYRKLDGEYQSDLDRTSNSVNALMLGQYQKNFSQEINLSGPGDATLSWMVGGFYYDSDAGNPYWTVIVGADAPNGIPFSSFTSRVRTRSYAGFGDLTWNVTDRLHLTGGARYTSETKKFDYRDIKVASGALVTKAEKDTWNSPTFRAIARYDLSRDSNVYASWSNGFKSGVFDAYSKLGIPVDPEKISAVEVGAKARLHGITFTAAAYNYDYKDIQVQSYATVSGALVLKLTNAAKAKMRGLEFGADGRLSDNLSFNAGLNWMPTAKYDDFTSAQVTVPIPGATGPIVGQVVVPYDASGSRVAKAPKWTANLGLTYTAPVAGGDLTGTLSGFYNPGFFWQPGNLTREDGYEVVNARLSWTDAQGSFTYSLWATNLTDSIYSTNTVPNVRGDSLTVPAGRQIGIGISYSF